MDEDEPDDNGIYPCPTRWFQKFSEARSAAKTLRCSVNNIFGIGKGEEVPWELQFQALMWQSIMDKALPALRKIYAQRARQRQREGDYME